MSKSEIHPSTIHQLGIIAILDLTFIVFDCNKLTKSRVEMLQRRHWKHTSPGLLPRENNAFDPF